MLVDPSGRVVASATEEYPLHTPRPGWAEQDPRDWWRGTVGAIRRVLAASGARPEAFYGLLEERLVTRESSDGPGEPD